MQHHAAEGSTCVMQELFGYIDEACTVLLRRSMTHHVSCSFLREFMLAVAIAHGQGPGQGLTKICQNSQKKTSLGSSRL